MNSIAQIKNIRHSTAFSMIFKSFNNCNSYVRYLTMFCKSILERNDSNNI